ncbi:5-formyltetrahydrofolate cyclo-ligase [Tenacibaculum sp. IB213877]|uniref:5-formyltetrahydrofolate cyclo-ligase n=1 Tax=Tenacibaculum sp. IB213877 TaxID=3097351 RepID=UPI002A5A1FF9|nr:5-formyltetrahydrofolate cyclo-ligase [Tenacibaculum sp. IB213877]MDY0780284.1 5-formyltetrahydrofolate cyclo-ligase [Tenacibaculum sp. IB213877]
MQKSELRKLYKQKRKELTKEEIEKFQQSIYKQVFDLDFSSIENIHIFLSIKRLIEIDTYPIIEFLRKLNKKIIVSKSDFSTNTLQHFLLDVNTQIKINSWGIPEPVNAIEVDVKEIDMVFVPLLISDDQNYRVGYGKGFYDRFLNECRKDVKTIGLSFFEPIKLIEDINEFDVSLERVIFPK